MTDIINFIQITDCHLYADKTAIHYGVNVYENLCLVLDQISKLTHVQFVVFTGDLTQDHSEASYKNFVDAIQFSSVSIPIYFLAGNHDEPTLLSKYLSQSPFCSNTSINSKHWQIQLIASKSDKPSGFISDSESKHLLNACDKNKHQLIMMHHHPVNVGYFIDRHGLDNREHFIRTLTKISQLKAIACGHVHNALELPVKLATTTIPLFTCPATSIQFDSNAATVVNSQKPPGYREFSLKNDGTITTQAHFLS